MKIDQLNKKNVHYQEKINKLVNIEIFNYFVKAQSKKLSVSSKFYNNVYQFNVKKNY